jgi:hypothetical protein
MKRNGMKSKWLEDSSDVDLWPTGSANVKVTLVKVDKFLYEFEDLITSGWNPRRVWTFIERIQDDENWALARQA